jgi:hypothetical protein
MPQEKPKKSVAVRDSIPLSTTPNPVNTSWGGAWVAPAVGANLMKPKRIEGSDKGKQMSAGKKALEMYKKRTGSK